MLAAVFGTRGQQAAVHNLRYQLLSGVVRTLVEAHASKADQAVLVVHVFAPPGEKQTRQSAANDAAWRAFVDFLDTPDFAAGQPDQAYQDRLVEVIVPGNAEIPSIPLLIGKTTSYLKQSA